MNTIEATLNTLNSGWQPEVVTMPVKRRQDHCSTLALSLREVWPYVRPVMRPMHVGEVIRRDHPINRISVEDLLLSVSCWEIEVRRIHD